MGVGRKNREMIHKENMDKMLKISVDLTPHFLVY